MRVIVVDDDGEKLFEHGGAKETWPEPDDAPDVLDALNEARDALDRWWELEK